MKKLLCVALCVWMLFTFCACDATISPKKESSDSQAQQKEDTFAVGDTAVFNNLKFTANEIRQSNGTEFFTPASGNTFVGVKFTIENTSDEEQSISSILQFEGYVNDVKCDYSISAACAFDEGTLDGALAPGKKMVGWYALEVPSDWATIEIDVKADILSNNTAKFIFKK